MAPRGIEPLKTALEHLKSSLELYRLRKENDPLPFLTVTKAFEVAVEYGWRFLKDVAEGDGVDVPSPKAAVRAAARLGLIADPEVWFDMIEARNASVHDYFGISEKSFVELAQKMVNLADSLMNKSK